MLHNKMRKRMIGKRVAALCAMLAMVGGLLGCGTGTAAAGETKGLLDTVLESAVTMEYLSEALNGEWDAGEAVSVVLSGTTARITAAENDEKSASGVTFDNGVLTISAAGTYALSGELTNGQVVVEAGKEDGVRLILNGVALTCENSAPLYVKQADQVILTLAEGSENTVTDGTEYVFADETEDEPNAAVFSKDDLIINGAGTLTVRGNYKHAITSKDDLVITGGTLNVTAAGDGIRGKDSVAIRDGVLNIEAGQDGIKSNNDTDETKGFVVIDGGSFKITAGNDGIQAETVLQTNGGTFDIHTGDGSASQEAKANSGSGQGFGGPGGGLSGEGAFQRGPGSGRNRQNASDGQPPERLPDGQLLEPLPDGQPPERPQEGAALVTDTAVDTAEVESDSTKGLKAGTALIVSGGSITIDSFDDALHSNGSAAVIAGELKLASGDDGIHADHILVIDGGTIDISLSYEGLEGAQVLISGGTTKLKSTDDGVNSAGGSDSGRGAQDSFRESGSELLHIVGGSLYVNAEGDGLDSNGDLTIDGGTVIIDGPTGGGNGCLDCDGTLAVNGGLLIAAGSAGMLQLPGETSSQSALSVTFTQTQTAGTEFRLAASDGSQVVSVTPVKDYQAVLISSPDLIQGETYQIDSGTGDVPLTSVTLSKTVTAITDTGEEASAGTGGFGGGPGGAHGGPRKENEDSK